MKKNSLLVVLVAASLLVGSAFAASTANRALDPNYSGQTPKSSSSSGTTKTIDVGHGVERGNTRPAAAPRDPSTVDTKPTSGTSVDRTISDWRKIEGTWAGGSGSSKKK